MGVNSNGNNNGGNYHYKGNLGMWLKYQRTAKRGQSYCKITPEHEALLQKLVDEGKLKIIE